MNELQKINRAKIYLENLANGVNPLTDQPVGENDIVNNVRISRCLFYVSDILGKIVENKGKFKVDKADRAPFSITAEQAAQFELSRNPISVSEITKRFNALIDPLACKELKLGVITNWLLQAGLLNEITVNNKKRRHPTTQGAAIGISVEERVSQMGTPYEAVLYDIGAQRFIVDNIEAIIAFDRVKNH
jgi:hypothetical protein